MRLAYKSLNFLKLQLEFLSFQYPLSSYRYPPPPPPVIQEKLQKNVNKIKLLEWPLSTTLVKKDFLKKSKTGK